MSNYSSGFSNLLFIGLAVIFIILCGIMAWAARLGYRLAKLPPPKWKLLYSIAFLQVLLGGLGIVALRALSDNPFLDIGAGLGIALLSGLFFIKWMLRSGWKPSLRVWAVSAGLQLVLVPLCAALLLVGLVALAFLLYPPLL